MYRFISYAAVVFIFSLVVDTCCGQSYSHQYSGHQYDPGYQACDGGAGCASGGVYESAVGNGYGFNECVGPNDGVAYGDPVFAGQGFGRPVRRRPIRNLVGASRVVPDCADCNWGPIYLSLFGGVSFLDNFDSRFTFDNGIDGELGVRETGFSMEDGVASGASIGRYFYRQGRVEAEYTYRDNAVGEFGTFTYSDDVATTQINDTLVDSTLTDASGSVESSSFIVNFLFDLKPRTVGCMNAYLGGGIGSIAVDGDATAGTAIFDFDDAAFAFQGIAGVNYPVLDRLDLFTEYRYTGSDNVRVLRTDMGVTESLGAFRFDLHNIVFGIRILR